MLKAAQACDYIFCDSAQCNGNAGIAALNSKVHRRMKVMEMNYLYSKTYDYLIVRV